MQLFDLHTHLNFLDITPAEAVKNALDSGIEKMITIGTCPKDHQTVLDLAEEFSPNVYCTLGVHPHDAKDYTSKVKEFILKNVSNPRMVAIGEIGLDYYYDNSPRDKQREAFEDQLSIALDHDLPVQIHTRDAEDDTIEILKKFNGKIRGVIHCFTGTQSLADECLALGLNISISGVVTFKKADELRDVVKNVPLDRMHVETDAPFLTPVPFRGKKNQPAYVVHVAEKVAELKNVSVDEIATQTRKNALDVFKKLEN